MTGSMTSAAFQALVAELLRRPQVRYGAAGKPGFGRQALHVKGRMFALRSASGEYVVKLSKDRVEALVRMGLGQRYEPRKGRPLKEWLLVYDADAAQALALTLEALGFVEGER